ncbi:MAG: CGGC domain-containing protein [Desulfobacterales bacterium]|nr:CGGC domain-containing protein [Desulfobacterales bacterium]
MKKIAIVFCEKIKDASCVGCIPCFKGIKEFNGEFERYKEEGLEVVSMTSCGNCPGLVIPRIKLITGFAKVVDREIDVIHLGTCVKKAMETAQCPLDGEKVAAMVKKGFEKPVVVGTHTY